MSAGGWPWWWKYAYAIVRRVNDWLLSYPRDGEAS